MSAIVPKNKYFYGGFDMFDDVFSMFDSNLFNTRVDSFRTHDRSTSYRMTEDDGVIVYEVELPGVKKDDVDVTADNGLINVSWKRNGKDHRLSLKGQTSSDEITAEMSDGLLIIKLGRERSPPQKVKIR